VGALPSKRLSQLSLFANFLSQPTLKNADCSGSVAALRASKGIAKSVGSERITHSGIYDY